MNRREFLFDRCECKPANYRFLSPFIDEPAFLNSDKNIIRTIEKVFLKTLVHVPPSEHQIRLRDVKVFGGSKRFLVSVLYSFFTSVHQKYSARLISSCKMNFN